MDAPRRDGVPALPPVAAERPRPRIAVSACILGEAVRHDGGHCRQRFLTEAMAPFVDWEPVCPEVGVGMGAPREAIRLVEVDGVARLRGSRSERDWTDAVEAWSDARLARLASRGVHGLILRRSSPTCGVGSAKLYHLNGHRAGKSRDGIFAAAAKRAFPLTAIEEDGRLNDQVLRQRFLTRVFTVARWDGMLRAASPRALVAFHTAHKMQLTAHDPEQARALGRLVALAGASGRSDPPSDEQGTLAETRLDGRAAPGFVGLLAAYERRLSACLARHVPVGRHVNVIQHLAGFVKRETRAEEVRELGLLVDEYVAGLVPLAVPLTLLRHFLRRYGAPDWVLAQTWLEPYPKSLGLRLA